VKNWLVAGGSLPVTVEETLIDGWTMPNVALANKYCLKLVPTPRRRALPVIEQETIDFWPMSSIGKMGKFTFVSQET
jgi:hypothetical protein